MFPLETCWTCILLLKSKWVYFVSKLPFSTLRSMFSLYHSATESPFCWISHYPDRFLWSYPSPFLSLQEPFCSSLPSLSLSVPPTCHLHAGGLIMPTNSPSVSLITLHWSTHYCFLSLATLILPLFLLLYLNFCYDIHTKAHVQSKSKNLIFVWQKAKYIQLFEWLQWTYL